MMKKQHQILAWETDKNLEPTGETRMFKSDSTRKVIRQIAHELGGDCGISGLIVKLPSGKKWAARRIY